MTRGRFAAASLALTTSASLLLAGTGSAGAAGAATNPDRGICDDGTGSIPPGAWLRNSGDVSQVVLYLTKTGYNGSLDHLYIEGEFYRGNAHWYTGYGYDHDNGITDYGAMLDSWVAKSTGGC
jgi:hypothetical protein